MNKGQSTGTSDRLLAEAISCVRGGRILFRDLRFALEPGQAGLLTGPNGVGKSSLLRLLAGLLQPSTGSYVAPESTALCDDKLALDEHLPLEQALRFWGRLDGKGQADITLAMARAGLDHLAEVPVRYFSTGQRQRARLARTYLAEAKLWLLDEPANGLETESVDQLGATLQNHIDGGGIILAGNTWGLSS